MLLCLLNTVMNYISRICNEGERHPFNPCSPYQQSFSNTNYKDFHGCYCLVACNSCLRRVIRSIRSIRVRFTSSVLFEHGL